MAPQPLTILTATELHIMTTTYYANTTPSSAQLVERANQLSSVSVYKVYYGGQWVDTVRGADSAEQAIDMSIEQNKWYSSKRNYFRAHR